MSTARQHVSSWISVLVVGVLVAGAGGAGCSLIKPSTCEDLQGLATQVRGLGELDLVAEGTDGLNAQLDRIKEAWKKVLSSSARQFGPELRRVQAAVEALSATLRGQGASPGNLVDAIAELQAGVTEVTEAWEALVAAVNSELSDCDLS